MTTEEVQLVSKMIEIMDKPALRQWLSKREKGQRRQKGLQQSHKEISFIVEAGMSVSPPTIASIDQN